MLKLYFAMDHSLWQKFFFTLYRDNSFFLVQHHNGKLKLKSHCVSIALVYYKITELTEVTEEYINGQRPVAGLAYQLEVSL